MSKAKKGPKKPTLAPFLHALEKAEPRPAPGAGRDLKKNYAQRFSTWIAQELADALRSTFPEILPDAGGGKHESKAQSARGLKKLDVNYSTPELGLALGVSVKTINF